MSGEVLVVVAGGARLGMPLGDVARLVLERPCLPVPFGHPALAGLMRGDDGHVLPVFDLRGLDAPQGERPPPFVAGATIAVVVTERGSVGLRLERLLGTARSYSAPDTSQALEERRAGLSPFLQRALGGAGLPHEAGHAVGDDVFFFFSAEAFVAALVLTEPA